MAGALTASVGIIAGSTPPLSVSISPKPVDSILNQTTVPTTATASGGVAPYSYSWTLISGTIGNINSPTSSVTTFTGDWGAIGSARCTVTDAVGQTAFDTVLVRITEFNPGFPFG